MQESRPYAERRVTVHDGLRLYCRDYGDPASPLLPVLCLTGLTRNSADFADLALRLAKARRVVCPDYRGRGRSDYDRDWRNYDPMIYLSDTFQILAALGIERAVVIGTSLGGILAQGLAVLRPASVAGIVINDIGPDIAPGGLDRILEFIARDRPQRGWKEATEFMRKAGLGVPDRDDAWWEKLARGTFHEGADGMLHYDWDVAIARPLLRTGGKVQDLWPIFRAVADLPVAVLRGTLSDVLTEEGLARMVEAKPDLVVARVPGIGHVPSLDEPEALAAIDAVLATVDAAAS